MQKESSSKYRKGREIYSIGSIGRDNSLYRVWFCNDQPQCAIWEIPIAHGSTLRKCVKTEQVHHPYKPGNLHMTEQERDVHRCKAWRNARELSNHCGTNPFSGPNWPVLWSDRNTCMFFVPRPGSASEQDPHFERDGEPYTVSRTAGIVLLHQCWNCVLACWIYSGLQRAHLHIGQDPR